MTAETPNVVVYGATLNIASELTSGRVKHGAEMGRYLRVFVNVEEAIRNTYTH
jgi:hypothetical protein